MVKTHDKEELQYFVQIYRVTKPKQANASIMEGGYAKLVFRFCPTSPLFEASKHAEAFQVAFLRALKAAGCQVKLGAPPRQAEAGEDNPVARA